MSLEVNKLIDNEERKITCYKEPQQMNEKENEFLKFQNLASEQGNESISIKSNEFSEEENEPLQSKLARVEKEMELLSINKFNFTHIEIFNFPIFESNEEFQTKFIELTKENEKFKSELQNINEIKITFENENLKNELNFLKFENLKDRNPEISILQREKQILQKENEDKNPEIRLLQREIQVLQEEIETRKNELNSLQKSTFPN